MAAWEESYKYAVGILRKKVNPYLRVLELYTVLMLIILLAWIIYYNLKGRDHTVGGTRPQFSDEVAASDRRSRLADPGQLSHQSSSK